MLLMIFKSIMTKTEKSLQETFKDNREIHG